MSNVCCKVSNDVCRCALKSVVKVCSKVCSKVSSDSKVCCCKLSHDVIKFTTDFTEREAGEREEREREHVCVCASLSLSLSLSPSPSLSLVKLADDLSLLQILLYFTTNFTFYYNSGCGASLVTAQVWCADCRSRLVYGGLQGLSLSLSLSLS